MLDVLEESGEKLRGSPGVAAEAGQAKCARSVPSTVSEITKPAAGFTQPKANRMTLREPPSGRCAKTRQQNQGAAMPWAAQGKLGVRRQLSVIEGRRVNLDALVTRRVKLSVIEAAYGLSSHRRDGLLRVALPR